MAKYYQDFVGLNTFIYVPVGWDPDEQYAHFGGIVGSIQAKEITPAYTPERGGTSATPSTELFLNHIGFFNSAAMPKKDGDKYGGIGFYKNSRFSHVLPTTASFLPSLLLHLNGPYGFPTWKQIRVGQNALSRKQIKENVFTIVSEPGDEFTFNRNEKIITQRARFGDILKYTEPPVVSKYNPLVIFGRTRFNGPQESINISVPLGNAICQFNNSELNQKLGLVNLKSNLYERIKKSYLKGGLRKDNNPLDVFEMLSYRENIYPPQIYTYKKFVRQRTTFSFPWRDDRIDRTNTPFQTTFNSVVSQSVWIMDAATSFDTGEEYASNAINSFGLPNVIGNPSVHKDFGILQNRFCSFNNKMWLSYSASSLSDRIAVAPLYSRKQTLYQRDSVRNTNGMYIEGVNTGVSFPSLMTQKNFPSGEATWDVGRQSGKNAFFDSYEKFMEAPRCVAQDSTIIPEFRISDHIGFYDTHSPLDENVNIFEVTGGLLNSTGSNQENFYEIYSNSDFLKNFEMVANDNKEMGEPLIITLKCKAIKKLLPYNGFYPQQRAVQIASEFFNAYSSSYSMSGAYETFGTSNAQFAFQNVMTPMFAPGLLFNAIKSGCAVDYPLITGSLSLTKTGSAGIAIDSAYDNWINHYCTWTGGNILLETPKHEGLIFHERVPFEALIKPSLLPKQIHCQEPHILGNTSASAEINISDGSTNYTRMMHNFLAETSNFFLQNKNYTTFHSKPSNELNQFVGNREYMMRVKMYKSTETAQTSQVSGGVGDKFFNAPQYSESSIENFTMYSRPTAFGPPTKIDTTKTLAAKYSNSQIVAATTYGFGNKSFKGENYPFTPPYYHGQAWADITFIPADGNRNYSVKEILATASVKYYRFVDPGTDTSPESIYDMPSGTTKSPSSAYANNYVYNKNALQLSASINLFNIERDETGDLNEETARWIIQSKWETPMLNFNHLTASSAVTMPINVSASVPRGMWHQYGRIEEDASKGVFMQVEDIDNNWIVDVLGKDSNNVKSLSDALGFSTEPKRMGEIANSKVLSEAIVAVPFIEEGGERKFFHIPREDIDLTLSALNEMTSGPIGDSIKDMVRLMRQYVFPPSMDFISNREIDPFSMYIFPFIHVLSKQDLADIWQGVYPDITSKLEKVESSISHPLLAQELLGGGAIMGEENGVKFIEHKAKGNKLPSKIRWMVFKVKQKGLGNYWATLVSQSEDKLNEVPKETYNWPYDYFSLIELAKIDAEVDIGKFNDSGVKTKPIIQPQGQTEPQSRAEQAEQAEQIGKESTSVLTTAAQASTAAPLGSAQQFQKMARFSTADSYDRLKTYNCSQLRAFVNAFAELTNVSPDSQSARSILSSQHRTQLSNC